MRYQNLKSFQKHLATAAPDHLCHCYLIILSDDYERTKWLKEILVAPNVCFSGAEVSVEQILDALSPTLFGGQPVVIVDEVERLDKKGLELLAANLPGSGYLLLGARKKISLTTAVEKEGVILDLSEEKPWDKEKRIAEQLSQRVEQAGKRLASDVAPLLFERIGIDPALLDREIDKLLCFVGERPTIERSDVFRISASNSTHTLWQTAEEIVWGEGKIALPEASAFHALLPALRSQLQLGCKIAALSSTGASTAEWSASLPKIWPKTLEKRRSQVERLGASYFQKGLKLLFDIELLSRTGSSQLTTLLDLFRMGIHAR